MLRKIYTISPFYDGTLLVKDRHAVRTLYIMEIPISKLYAFLIGWVGLISRSINWGAMCTVLQKQPTGLPIDYTYR